LKERPICTSALFGGFLDRLGQLFDVRALLLVGRVTVKASKWL
jgi:hypothetical protein